MIRDVDVDWKGALAFILVYGLGYRFVMLPMYRAYQNWLKDRNRPKL